MQSVEWWGPSSVTMKVSDLSGSGQTAKVSRTVEGLYYMHAVQKIQSCYDKLWMQNGRYDIFIDRDYLKEYVKAVYKRRQFNVLL